DAVQFLQRKTRTEEEFFHTFNALHDEGRQIVLTSDRPPHDLRALEDRLRERFQAGLIADVRPPDPSTRLAILRKRAHHDDVNLAEEQAAEVTGQSLLAIGEQLGGRDHTTVLHACKRTSTRIDSDESSRQALQKLCTALHCELP